LHIVDRRTKIRVTLWGDTVCCPIFIRRPTQTVDPISSTAAADSAKKNPTRQGPSKTDHLGSASREILDPYKKDNLVSIELQAGFQNALVESAHMEIIF
jgi:hypothetical protein